MKITEKKKTPRILYENLKVVSFFDKKNFFCFAEEKEQQNTRPSQNF